MKLSDTSLLHLGLLNLDYPDDLNIFLSKVPEFNVYYKKFKNRSEIILVFPPELTLDIALVYHSQFDAYFIWNDEHLNSKQFIEKMSIFFNIPLSEALFYNSKNELWENFMSAFLQEILCKGFVSTSKCLSSHIIFSDMSIQEIGNTFISINFVLRVFDKPHQLEGRLAIDGKECAFFAKNSFKSISLTESLFSEIETELSKQHFRLSPYCQNSFHNSYIRRIFRNLLITNFKETNEYRIRAAFEPTLHLIE